LRHPTKPMRPTQPGSRARALHTGGPATFACALAASVLAGSLLAAPAIAAQEKAAIVTQKTLPAIPKELEPIRESLSRYRDYNAAEGEVFVAIGCVDYGLDNGAGMKYSGQDVEQVMV